MIDDLNGNDLFSYSHVDVLLTHNSKYDLSGSFLTSTVSESVLQNSVWFAPSSELCAFALCPDYLD